MFCQGVSTYLLGLEQTRVEVVVSKGHGRSRPFRRTFAKVDDGRIFPRAPTPESPVTPEANRVLSPHTYNTTCYSPLPLAMSLPRQH